MDMDNILPFKLDTSYLFVSMIWSAIRRRLLALWKEAEVSAAALGRGGSHRHFVVDHILDLDEPGSHRHHGGRLLLVQKF